MKLIKKTCFLAVLLVAVLLVQNASALIYLPDSTYAESVGNWQGFRIHEENGFGVRIDFAVYDTENVAEDNLEEKALVEALQAKGMSNKYIYAYQVFQPIDDGDYTEVGYFGITRADGNDVIEADDAMAQDDLNGGKEPDDISNSLAQWSWSGFGVSNLGTGEHSYFLAFSSAYAPIAGRYVIRETASESGTEVPSEGHVPEPATLVLLGLGGVMASMKRRRAVAGKY